MHAEIRSTPVGKITVVADGNFVIAIHFGKTLDAEHEASGITGEVFVQLNEYFAGRRKRFDLKLRVSGTTFQMAVWKCLRRIPYGQTISYGEIAMAIGKPRASRAVGAACGCNPISILIPCHRVVGFDGRLTGLGGGLPIKRQLLALEKQSYELSS
jgi:methylated-DNA-[protein]-cysteine S-methyltransferase